MPAAFVLILQQLLLTGASILTVVALAQPVGGALSSDAWPRDRALTIYLPALALYFIVLPRFYGFSTLGQPLQLLRSFHCSFWRRASWARRPAPGSDTRKPRL